MSQAENFTIHDMPDAERPRERLLQHGSDALSTAELLAIILRTGTAQENVLQMAGRLLAHYDGLRGLARVSAAELTQFKGLGDAKAAQVLAALALGQRASMIQPEERPQINKAADAARLLTDMGHLPQEQVRVMLLDNARRLISIQTVYIGTVNMSVLRVAELYREAIVRNSPAIVVAHNHPSGDLDPSPEDIELTRALLYVCEYFVLTLREHAICVA
jgi:DNA repair protein RadC